MNKIYFKVSGQSLTKTGGLSTYASDTVEYIQAEFILSDEWKEYDSVRAVWQNGDIVAPPSVLDSEGKCLVPFEVLTERGRVTVNLVGSSANGIILTKRITSYIVTAFMVTVKVNIDGSDPQTITPSQFEQFVEAVKDNADRAEAGAGEAKDEADRAESEAESALASAQAAESSATRASNYVADARGYANSASDSADASASSATASANSASASAGSAADSANSASASATSAREAEAAKETILRMRAVATSLPEGSQATASYSDGVLTLGIPKGDKGDTGNGIDHVVLNEDYTLTIFFTDGTSTITTSIRGEKGETGAVPDFTIGEVVTLDPDEEASAEITGTAENPILNLGIPQGKTGEVSYEDLSSLLPTDTASGDIISIPDGQPIIPVQSLKVQLDPIQDLHGYDKPWSAGAGKNKLNVDAITNREGLSVTNGSIVVTTGSGSDNVSTTERLGDISNLVVGETYTLSFSTTETSYNYIYLRGSREVWSNGTQKTITQEALDGVVSFYAGTENTATISDIMIRLSSVSDATFEPYSNVSPIDGWKDIDTHITGANIWDEEWEVGSINATTGEDEPNNSVIRCTGYTKAFPNTTYYISNPEAAVVFFYDSEKNYIDATTRQNQTFTTPSNTAFIRFRMSYAYGSTYKNDISINYPSTDHEYHAYDGTTYTTALGQTVYGGTLDVVSGELVVDRAMVDLGSLSWSRYTPSATNIPVFYAGVSGMLKANEGASLPLCSSYRCEAWTDLSRREDGTLQPHPTLALIYVADSRFDNVDSFASAVQGVQLVYELATPQTYQLDPTEVDLLLGQNNLWTDCGSVEVTYKADIQRYIDKKLS